MKTQQTKLFMFLTLISFVFWGCQTNQSQNTEEVEHEEEYEEHATHEMKEAVDIEKAICVLYPTKGNETKGEVVFTKTSDGIHVKASVSGLTEGKHGFHIHQYGDCSGVDGKTAGGHFNPEDMEHGGPDAEMRHVGDMGNLEASADGMAMLEYTDPHLTFQGANSIIGRGIIVHAGEDDLVSQPTGAAGARVACGVIGVAE